VYYYFIKSWDRIITNRQDEWNYWNRKRLYCTLYRWTRLYEANLIQNEYNWGHVLGSKNILSYDWAVESISYLFKREKKKWYSWIHYFPRTIYSIIPLYQFSTTVYLHFRAFHIRTPKNALQQVHFAEVRIAAQCASKWKTTRKEAWASSPNESLTAAT
jgi:hypothetical protein